jgi:sigma-E factor negative regulatory protein RseC
MEQKAKVCRLLPNGMAQVMVVRESACSGDCHKCAGCGAAKETLLFDAQNAVDAKPGDVVVIQSESGPVLKAAAVLYLLPLVLFFAGYALGDIWQMGELGGCLAFALGIAAAVAYDRLSVKKKETVYTITGFVSKKGHGAREERIGP